MLKPSVHERFTDRLGVTPDQIVALCQRWKITEFALFGSILRDDFRPDSDVDVLVTFAPHDGWSLFDLMNLQRELEGIIGRPVDLLEKRDLKNPFRRTEILQTCQVIYGS
jgi:predicted nucleotidyltransferase